MTGTPAPRSTLVKTLNDTAGQLKTYGCFANLTQRDEAVKAILQAAADLANAPTREELITTITSVPILNGNGWIGNYDQRIADALIASGKVRVRG